MVEATDVHPFRAAWETRDLVAWADALAPDVVADSPMLTTPFAGRDTVVELYSVLFETLADFQINHELGDGDARAFFWHATAGNRRIEGVDLVRINEAGKVCQITVWIRPLVAIAAFGSAVAPPLAAKRDRLRGQLARLISAPLRWVMALVDLIAPRLVKTS
jgi:hypothetical protein